MVFKTGNHADFEEDETRTFTLHVGESVKKSLLNCPHTTYVGATVRGIGLSDSPKQAKRLKIIASKAEKRESLNEIT